MEILYYLRYLCLTTEKKVIFPACIWIYISLSLSNFVFRCTGRPSNNSRRRPRFPSRYKYVVSIARRCLAALDIRCIRCCLSLSRVSVVSHIFENIFKIPVSSGCHTVALTQDRSNYFSLELTGQQKSAGTDFRDGAVVPFEGVKLTSSGAVQCSTRNNLLEASEVAGKPP